MSTVLSADHPLHVETDGDDRRPCLVLLNPLGTTLEHWDPLVEELMSRNWIVRFDMRGQGRSGGDVGDFTVADLARDVVAVLDALEVPRAHILGDSMGALVAANVAAHHPGRVDRLVLAGCGVYLGKHTWWEETVRQVESGGLEAIADHVEDVFFSQAWQDTVPDRLANARTMLLETAPDCYVAGARAILAASLEDVAYRIRATTLLIGGADDPMFTHFPITDLLTMIPDSEAVNVDGARHRVLLEQPEILAPLINEFLSDPDAR